MTKLVQSLNTTNLREAVLMETKKRARLQEEFDHKRLTLSAQRLGTVCFVFIRYPETLMRQNSAKSQDGYGVSGFENPHKYGLETALSH